MIIRSVLVILGAVLMYLLQTSVFSAISLAGVVPDLMVILVCSVGFMRGRIKGTLAGFVCGLIVDCCFGNYIGIFALIYMTIGYLAGFGNKIFDEDDYTLPLIIIAVGEFLFNVAYYVFFLLLSGKLNIGFYFVRYMVPRIVYTLLAALLFYRLFNMVNTFMMRFDEE